MAAGFDEIDTEALQALSSRWETMAVCVGFVLMFLAVPATKIILTRPDGRDRFVNHSYSVSGACSFDVNPTKSSIGDINL